jgi:hypothetical protein
MTDLLAKSLRQFYLARDSGVKWAIWREKAPPGGFRRFSPTPPSKKINDPILTAG